ncbi:MAG: glycoside hydrolase family 9 protein [Chitinophagaceae bacterium]|nr:glycoside hydrolase family 9 protein [Chitinophagaceae bacterium]
MNFTARLFALVVLFSCNAIPAHTQTDSWIRINQLGYPTASVKVAVWCSKQKHELHEFEVVDAATQKTVYKATAGKTFGAYGPFTETYRLNFSAFSKPGRYFIRAGSARSPEFPINNGVYKGTADFCLRYMRQQRSGFNPFLKDSCHTHDGYTLYGPMPDSTHINTTGGWHDASDYLQYSTTSANATWHLLAAYRDFKEVFSDQKLANGLDGRNGIPDVLDEARWGLDWLLKMNPRPDWLFNQLGDDRDHMGMRIPKEDNFYGKGFERPVYFVSGKPQQRGKFMNATTGGASTAGKFASAFAAAADVYAAWDTALSLQFFRKAIDAYKYGERMPGVAQTVSVRSPYIYAEGNWTDDMELGAAEIFRFLQDHGLMVPREMLQTKEAYRRAGNDFASQEPVTPWLGQDTANHYQWYPFVNPGHYQLARNYSSNKNAFVNFYRQGIEKVWKKAAQNAFYRGIPFIWCSNNLTVAFAQQCFWYEQMSGDKQFAELEQANFDWLFGCNPWGTSMVYGLPANGDTPVDPHSAFTHLKNYPIDGGLVDGPVYTSIYKNLIGIKLVDADEYAEFQSDLAVYHDDYGDYSTNEPTMDGTASLIYLLAAKQSANMYAEGSWSAYPPRDRFLQSEGTFIRGDSTRKEVALVFTGDEFGDGLQTIARTLNKQKVKGSFYFTGRFYRNKDFQPGISALYRDHHLMGMHSDQHLLYADWNKRGQTLVTRDSLFTDLGHNEEAMLGAGIAAKDRREFLIPPYEWWNREVSGWLKNAGYTPFSFTPGTTSNADYTYPEMGASYRSSESILTAIKNFDTKRPGKLNGVILLIHAGTDPRRKDKFYDRLDELIGYLKEQGYTFKRIDELLR